MMDEEPISPECDGPARLAEVSDEIRLKQQFDEAIQLLAPSGLGRRNYIEREIVNIVAQFRDDIQVDQVELPDRRTRRRTLTKIGDGASTLESHWRQLTAADRLHIATAADPALNEILATMDAVEIDVESMLSLIAKAAKQAADNLPGKGGGAPAEISRLNLARLCLRLYAEFRDDRQSPNATKNGYMDFLSLVHSMATDEEASLEVAANQASREMRTGTGFFRVTVKDKT